MTAAANREGEGALLLVLAHPTYEHSRANRALFDAVGVRDGVTLHDLYETYPDFGIDIRHEQALLVAHRTIMLQFPLYWYATPALLKEWFDLVWLQGFAYGERGTRLAGKTLSCVITTGGDTASYGPDGRHGHAATEFLRPLERTAYLCGMRWDDPLILHSDRLDDAAGHYLARIEALIAGAPP
jgi:glutathione-regulated potassium-efflux system ancillary protein KefG